MNANFRSPFESVRHMQSSILGEDNGRAGRFVEIGTSGIEAWSGFIQRAYHAELRWPEVFPLFDRIRRSDPEIAIIRNVFSAFVRSISFEWDLPEKPTDDDKRAQDFAYSVLEDVEGGYERLRDALVAYVPFYGWGWWEVVPGLRRRDWTPPPHKGEPDGWRSDYDDGLIGVRRFAWRDPSSFYAWDISERTGKLRGLRQLDLPNEPVVVPLERSIHVVFGDTESPEGLSPLEAVWRLERIKYGLELVQGIGFEHAAGYLNVESEKAPLTDEDKAHIRAMARAVMSVQEGNYVAWPKGMRGELKDVPFSAAATLMEAIRYYGLLKLQIYTMAWVAIASTAGTGAYAAAQDLSTMFIQVFNAMMQGFVTQIDRQFGKRLFAWNADAFPNLSARPRLSATTLDKQIALDVLGRFMADFAQFSPLSEDDLIALRRKTGFLPETLPKQLEEEVAPMKKSKATSPEAEQEKSEQRIAEAAQMQARPLVTAEDEQPLDVTYLADVSEDDLRKAIARFRRWAKENDPNLAAWLDAKPAPPEEVEGG